ncbi:MAG: DUF1343 domain-containing protein [Odoribacter sp.]|nr:DUF1343 domain-containing protein [Odoribacter sp.]
MKRLTILILVMSMGAIHVNSMELEKKVRTGAENFAEYFKLVEGKNVAIVANQTSMVGNTHLVDTLLSLGIKVKHIFAPEHGFRHLADAGEAIKNGLDTETGIPVISLYGKQYKPTPDNLMGVDVVIFDIQDVGTRFYTYISTLHYVLESCAENNVRCMVLDRPNPNGFYFDGNIPDISSYRSFVCMDPIPIVHGLTVGEYAMMANGEGWLAGGIKCDLMVIKCRNYTHKTLYEIPVKPSPNLPNQTSIYLYPSLCFFEGTDVSCGRGTAFPFQTFGSPTLPDRGFSFTPASVPGAANPVHLGKQCFGTDLRNSIENMIVPSPGVNLEWVINAYREYPEKDKFFKKYFDTLAGGPTLREQIIKGMTAEQIRATWKEGLEKYAKMRKGYLLYK